MSNERNPDSSARLEDDCAGAVAEQDERRAVGPVEDLRENVGADHERTAREAGDDGAVALGERVHEARAAGGDVVGGGFAAAELGGHESGGRREAHVGTDRADDRRGRCRPARRPRPPALSAQRKARRPRSARSRRRSCAPGSRFARGSTRRRSRRTPRDRRSRGPAPGHSVPSPAIVTGRPIAACVVTPEPPRRSVSRERPARRRPSPSPSPCRRGRGRPRPRTAGRACPPAARCA